MSWHEDKTLTQQKQQTIPIRVLPPKINVNQPQLMSRQRKNSKTIKMPIPKFDMDHMDESDVDDNYQFKMSLGLQRQTSFLISSQMTSLPLRQTNASIQTQTEDFTFLENLFSEPRVYEIPVEVQVQEFPQLCEREIQVSQSLLAQSIQKLQQNLSAVRRQSRLEMNSGTISLSIENVSLSRIDRPNSYVQGNQILPKQNNFQNLEFEDEQMLLQSTPDNQNKESLYRTKNCEMTFGNNQFFNSYSPQKSRISGTQSSPETDNAMGISQREINMMQTKNMASPKIDEQEYEDLQRRLYLIEQQNIQKSDLIDQLNKKISQQSSDLQRLIILKQQNLRYEQSCKSLSAQLQGIKSQYFTCQDRIMNLQSQLANLHKKGQNKQHQAQDMIITKQRQIEQLEKQINSYRDELSDSYDKLNKKNELQLNIINEKNAEINDVKAEHDRKYELYVISIDQMKRKIQAFEIEIQQMENIINSKDATISRLKDQNHKLKQETFILYKRISDMKDQVVQPSRQNSSLQGQQQNQNAVSSSYLAKHVNKEKTPQKQNLPKNAQTSRSSISRVISPNKLIGKNDLDKQSNIIHQEQKESDYKIINKEQSQSDENEQMKQQEGQIFIQESKRSSQFANYSFQKYANQKDSSMDLPKYSIELEMIIISDQNIILRQLQTIEQLQQKVIQFLKDALTKQSEAELLYSQLCQYENSMNGMMLQKIEVELENKRLKKMIADSQNKLSILGCRLIKIAKANSNLSYKTQPKEPNSSHSLEDHIMR